MDEIDIKKVMYDGVQKLGNGLILLSLLPDLYFPVFKAFFHYFMDLIKFNYSYIL